MRILIIEDNAELADALKTGLKREGYAVDAVANGDTADHLLSIQEFDLVILDLGLPKLSGDKILSNMRRRGSKTPVLILTARSSMQQKIDSLDLGADDYMTKPFELAELLARVRAILRRGMNESAPKLAHGRLSFDTLAKRVTIDGQNVDLRPRELNLLEILLRSIGRVVTKQQLAEHLYSFDDDTSDNAIEVYMHRLRKKIPSDIFSIRTIRGLGYMVEPPE